MTTPSTWRGFVGSRAWVATLQLRAKRIITLAIGEQGSVLLTVMPCRYVVPAIGTCTT